MRSRLSREHVTLFTRLNGRNNNHVTHCQTRAELSVTLSGELFTALRSFYFCVRDGGDQLPTRCRGQPVCASCNGFEGQFLRGVHLSQGFGFADLRLWIFIETAVALLDRTARLNG